jgi:hypothetical protein
MPKKLKVFIVVTFDHKKIEKGNYTTYTHWGDEGSTICDKCEADPKTTYVYVYSYTLQEALSIVEEMEKDRECVNKDTYKVEGTSVSFKYIDEDGDEQTFCFDRKINCVYLDDENLEDYSRSFYLNDIDKFHEEGERGYVDLFNFSLSEVEKSEKETNPEGSELEVAKALFIKAEKKVKEAKDVLEEAENKAKEAKAKFEEATKKSEAEEKIKTQISDFDAAQKLAREQFLASLS